MLLQASVNLFVRAMPAHLLAYYPFHERLRFRLRSIWLVIFLIQVIHSFCYGYAIQLGGSGRLVEYSFASLYMGIYFFCIQDDRYKLLFLYIFVMDYLIILRGFSTFLEARLFYKPNMTFYSWKSSLISLISLIISVPFILRLFTRAKECVFRMDAPAFWKMAWMVPAFTTAIVLAFTNRFTIEQVYSLRFLLARILLLLCVLVFYSILLNALDQIRQQAILVEQAKLQEHLLAAQKLQYTQLIRHIEETKIARHDLRQHLSIIHTYAQNRDIEKLLYYLTAYEETLPKVQHKLFCLNFAVNILLTYYAEEAQKYQIAFDVNCPMPEQLPISEPEFCALLGNLLENAIEACQAVTNQKPFIRVCSNFCGDMIFLVVDNTYQDAPIQKQGRFLSTKHKGYGLGTYSITSIAQRNHGSATFDYHDGVFYASIFLKREA